jgi:nucleoside-diphosphate-sugar epimerase
MSKLITERLILDLISSNQKAFIIRVSLVYGPGIFKDDTRVIYKFINEALLGKIVLSGSQNAIRRYLFIDDFIDMLIEIKNHDAGIYNLGGKEPISIIQLANLIATITGSSLEIISTENQQKDSSPPEVNISMAKLENQITYRNNVSLQSGIEKIINWLKMIEN